jgi:UDP-N-acetylglucosamine 4,6-dehydratase/5-epimerase
MKFVAGESFIVDAEKSTVRLSTAIYGNVLNSTGSIIPLIWDAIKNKYELTLYSPQMTRFMIDINNAIQLIEYGLETSGYNVIPNLKSFLIKDLFELYSEFFGLKYKIGTPRISEKLHELMISKEEINRTYFDVDKNTFFMHYKDQYCKDLSFENFSSDLVTVSKEELNNILKTYNYFKP